MDIPFSQAYKVLVRQNTRCSNRLRVSYDERNAAESSRQRQSFTYFLLKEEFGQYDLYLFCSFLALPADYEIYHCAL